MVSRVEKKTRTSGTFAVRRAVDIAMTALIVLLLASQITGQMAHEWLGISMSALVIVHTILNRVWYRNIFRGKYRTARIVQAAVNLALLVCFVLTAVSGILMSQYAVTFLRQEQMVSSARSLHLGISHWTFVLISVHLGLHWGMMVQSLKRKKILWRVLSVLAVLAAGYGMLLSVRAQIYDYMLFRVQFAFLDYSKPAVQVLLENILMMASWMLPSFEVMQILRNGPKDDAHRRLLSLCMIAAEFLVAFVLSRIMPAY